MYVDIYNTDKKYNIIYADPPWNYVDKMTRHSFSLEHEYPTMKKEDIWDMGEIIKKISHKDCILFIWITNPCLLEGIETIKKWGFKYKTLAFCWNKKTKHGKDVSNLGRWTMGNVELCFLAAKGKPQRICKNIKQLVIAERTKHSKKPDCVRERIVELMGDLPRIELFARQTVEGWDCWGNEVGGEDE